MDKDIRELRELVAKIVSEIEESDLVVKKDAGQTWEQLSSELRSDVERLIDHITKDEYQKALDAISEVSATMKIWKHRIVMGGKAKKSGEDYDLSRFGIVENEAKEGVPTREELANALSILLGILDEERAYKSKDHKPVPDGWMQTYANMNHARELLKKMGMTAAIVKL